MSLGASTPGPKAPRWAWWVATGFGSGYLKPAPGTWGTLAAVAVWFGLFSLAVYGPSPTLCITILLCQFFLLPLGITLLGIKASTLVSRESGMKDPSFIVVDEWAGAWIALMALLLHIPLWRVPLAWQLARLAAPFCLFRLFDIWKPWPIFQIQRLPEGKGIVMDDVLAGLYAAILTYFLDGALLTWLHHRQFP